jgi:hypothetical protein
MIGYNTFDGLCLEIPLTRRHQSESGPVWRTSPIAFCAMLTRRAIPLGKHRERLQTHYNRWNRLPWCQICSSQKMTSMNPFLGDIFQNKRLVEPRTESRAVGETIRKTDRKQDRMF